jgi:hypothetical protein
MTVCPKCRSKKISGPMYQSWAQSWSGHERLLYLCRRCGYEETGPTADTKRREAGEPEGE